MVHWNVLQVSIHKLQRNLVNLQQLLQGVQSIFNYCLHVLPLMSKILTGMLGNTSLCDLPVPENFENGIHQLHHYIYMCVYMYVCIYMCVNVYIYIYILVFQNNTPDNLSNIMKET